MLVIGAAAGAGSFRPVHDVAAAHGQEGWLAWADAVVLELMSVASGLELRRRERVNASVVLPSAVLGAAVVLSLGAQVVDAEPSVIGWLAAAIPALGFLVMVKIALARAASAPTGVVPTPPEPVEGRSDQTTKPATATSVRQVSEAASEHPTPMSPGRIRPELDPVVVALVPAARAVAAEIEDQRRRLSRHALADALRAQGYGVSNARASAILSILMSEREASPVSLARTQMSRLQTEPSAQGTLSPRPPAVSSTSEPKRRPITTPPMKTMTTTTGESVPK
jgi:hypothetical protein